MILKFKKATEEIPADYSYVVFKAYDGKIYPGYYAYDFFHAPGLHKQGNESDKVIRYNSNLSFLRDKISEWAYLE
jgi:hypothetical protein